MAETNVTYLDQNGKQKWLIIALRIITLTTIVYATFVQAGAAWKLGDIGVGIIAWLNIVAILILQKPALKASRSSAKKERREKSAI